MVRQANGTGKQLGWYQSPAGYSGENEAPPKLQEHASCRTRG